MDIFSGGGEKPKPGYFRNGRTKSRRKIGRRPTRATGVQFENEDVVVRMVVLACKNKESIAQTAGVLVVSNGGRYTVGIILSTRN